MVASFSLLHLQEKRLKNKVVSSAKKRILASSQKNISGNSHTLIDSWTNQLLLQLLLPFKSPEGDTQRGIATLSEPQHQDVAHSRSWELAGRAEG